MAYTAAHLVDRVLPSAPYRQWVLSLPKPLRLRVARDPAWASWVGGLIVRAVAAWQWRVARARSLAAPRTGAITFVQRFGGLVNLNVHFHLLIPDGVFNEADAGLMFTLLPAPTGRNLLAILDRVIRRVARRLAREQPDDAAADESPPELFAQIQAEAVTTWRSPATADRVRGSDRLRAWCDGFSLHAGVVVPDYDRAGLERLCRYGARPAFAHDRLAWTADGRISYRLKRPWPDGRTHLVLEPVAFLRRLVGIIPPPRRHLVRYAGVFGPASKARSKLRADPRCRSRRHDEPTLPSIRCARCAHQFARPTAAVGRPVTPRVRRGHPPLPVRRASQRHGVRGRRTPRAQPAHDPGVGRRARHLRPGTCPTQVEFAWDDPA